MNYFPFHLGDYAAHTAHLEPMEDLAYRRMLDLYYLREQALPEDPEEIARLIRLRGHVAEIKTVLREFFTNNDGDGWIHTRCEEEIRKMQDKQAKARASAQASVNARSANAQRTFNERSTDVKHPLNEGSATNTNTNTTIAPKEHRGRATRLPPDWSLPDEWREWAIQARPDLRIATVAEDFADYWHAKPGKDGTKLDWPATWRRWVREQKAPRGQTFTERTTAAKAARLAEMTGGMLGPAPERGEVIDMEAPNGPTRLLA